MAIHNDLGKKGEELALNYLQQKGYSILETNYRHKKEEVDIIAKDKDSLVVVEVKPRSTNIHGSPKDAVGPKKQTLLIQAANAYLEENGLDMEIRFDIISITLSPEYQIEHIKDAFYP